MRWSVIECWFKAAGCLGLSPFWSMKDSLQNSCRHVKPHIQTASISESPKIHTPHASTQNTSMHMNLNKKLDQIYIYTDFMKQFMLCVSIYLHMFRSNLRFAAHSLLEVILCGQNWLQIFSSWILRGTFLCLPQKCIFPVMLFAL